MHPDHSEHKVAFVSQTLTPAERRYSAVQKEALVCVCSRKVPHIPLVFYIAHCSPAADNLGVYKRRTFCYCYLIISCKVKIEIKILHYDVIITKNEH